MATFTYNRTSKDGNYLGYRQVGVPGQVVFSKKMLTPEALANPPASIEISGIDFAAPGADAVTKEKEKTEKQIARDNAKMLKAQASAEKAAASLEKLQAKATAAADRAAAALAKAQGATVQ